MGFIDRIKNILGNFERPLNVSWRRLNDDILVKTEKATKMKILIEICGILTLKALKVGNCNDLILKPEKYCNTRIEFNKI